MSNIILLLPQSTRKTYTFSVWKLKFSQKPKIFNWWSRHWQLVQTLHGHKKKTPSTKYWYVYFSSGIPNPENWKKDRPTSRSVPTNFKTAQRDRALRTLHRNLLLMLEADLIPMGHTELEWHLWAKTEHQGTAERIVEVIPPWTRTDLSYNRNVFTPIRPQRISSTRTIPTHQFNTTNPSSATVHQHNVCNPSLQFSGDSTEIETEIVSIIEAFRSWPWRPNKTPYENS